MKGIPLSAEHRMKIGLALQCKPKSAEHIAKLIGNKGRTGQTLTEEHKKKLGEAHRVYPEMEKFCVVCNVPIFRRSEVSIIQFEAKKYCSRKCKNFYLAESNKGKIMIPPMPHDRNPAWKGGAINYLRKQTRIRDDYTCQICNLRDPQIMEVDHILPKSVRPELECSLDNLITLCPNDHRRKTNADRKRYRTKSKKWKDIPLTS